MPRALESTTVGERGTRITLNGREQAIGSIRIHTTTSMRPPRHRAPSESLGVVAADPLGVVAADPLGAVAADPPSRVVASDPSEWWQRTPFGVVAADPPS